jgi:hypothetical protein
MMSGEGLDKKENGGGEHSDIYIGDMLNLEDSIEHGKGREGVSRQLPAVTRSGRVVMTCRGSQYKPPMCSRIPNHRQSSSKICYTTFQCQLALRVSTLLDWLYVNECVYDNGGSMLHL